MPGGLEKIFCSSTPNVFVEETEAPVIMTYPACLTAKEEAWMQTVFPFPAAQVAPVATDSEVAGNSTEELARFSSD